jgi:murein DD-endopeptidase MepM/ murein hydrolase activator NlpD
MALNSPGSGRPGHGTDFLGQRHAVDFVRPTGRRRAPYGAFALAHAYGVVPASAFAAWDQPVYAAEPGRVVTALDGWPDRRWINAVWSLLRLRLGPRIRPIRITAADWRPLTGNYILIAGASGVAMYGHLRNGSLRVRPGEEVSAGALLGTVGNSGRTSMPHLHFHLMDRADGLHARGLPFRFRDLERREQGHWVRETGCPADRTWIRSVDP